MNAELIVGNKTGHVELPLGFVFTDLPGQFLGKQNIPSVSLVEWGHKGRSLQRVGFLIPSVVKKGLEQKYKASQVKRLQKEHQLAFANVQNIKSEISIKSTANRQARLKSAIEHEKSIFLKFSEALELKELFKNS